MKIKKIAISALIAAAITALFFCGGERKDAETSQADGEAALSAESANLAPDRQEPAHATLSHAAAPPVPAELEEAKAALDGEDVLNAIGVGQSSNQNIARSISVDHARGELTRTIEHTNAAPILVLGTSVNKTVSQYNVERGFYTVFSLVTADEVIMRQVGEAQEDDGD